MSRGGIGTRLYVGNLPPDVREREIEDIFRKYGRITQLDLRNKKGPPFCFVDFDDSRDAEDAIHGRDGYELDGYKIRVEFPRSYRDRDGRFTNPRFGGDRFGGDRRGGFGGSRGGGGGGGGGAGDRDFGRNNYNKFSGNNMRRSKYRVLVTGLPSSGSWQDLKDHMREAGDVCYADVNKDGTGSVEFLRYEDMKYACKKLDDTKFRSHEGESAYIRVKAAESEGGSSGKARSRSRSRSGGSPAKSRSRSPVARAGDKASPEGDKDGSERGTKREHSASRSRSRSSHSKSKSPSHKSKSKSKSKTPASRSASPEQE